MSLPTIYTVIQCGHCFSNLVNEESEVYLCRPCRLVWTCGPFDDMEASFADEGTEPCGAPNILAPMREHSGYRFWEEPCSLPEDHEGMHHHALGSERLAA